MRIDKRERVSHSPSYSYACAHTRSNTTLEYTSAVSSSTTTVANFNRYEMRVLTVRAEKGLHVVRVMSHHFLQPLEPVEPLVIHQGIQQQQLWPHSARVAGL